MLLSPPRPQAVASGGEPSESDCNRDCTRVCCHGVCGESALSSNE